MINNLKLTRPLVFLDLETTGIDVATDQIIEISMIKITPGAEGYEKLTSKIRPLIKIKEEATAVHGVTNVMLEKESTFATMLPLISLFLFDSDISGFGIKRFDIPLLANEYKRCGAIFTIAGRTIVDTLEIYHKQERRNLEAAVKFYCKTEHEGAHGAEADALAVIKILEKQIAFYIDKPIMLSDLADVFRKPGQLDLAGCFIENEQKVITCNFGKYKGTALKMVPTQYLSWMIGQGFMDDTVTIAQTELKRRS